MSTQRTNSESAVLEQYRVSLENVTKPPISSIMSEFGYTAEVIDRGKAVYLETRQAFDSNKTEDDETVASYKTFTDKKESLDDLYSGHRKKAKVIFRNDPVKLGQLSLTGRMPHAYVNWMERIRKFYSVVSVDETIQSQLNRLRITPEEVTLALSLIVDVDVARADYLREKGESQDATQLKDAAISKLDDWMSEFYAVAKIALEDHPQLLESLGKSVKS